MSESAGSTYKRARAFPGEGELLVNDLLEENGLSTEEFRNLSPAKKRGVMDKVRTALKDPDVQAVLQSRKHGGLEAQETQAIREALGVEKWTKLGEVVSYVQTLLGEKTPEERSELFATHLAFGVDANEIQHTLTRIHDVMPARIDTDIKHQSSLFYRAVVEVASNALDASVKHKSPIGRFGIGFYQILNHLQDPNDKVVVRTKSAELAKGTKIEFRNRNGDIVVNIADDDSIAEHGTSVELRSKEFQADKAEDILRQYFTYTQDAKLVINGKQLDRWNPDGGAVVPDEIPSIDVSVSDGKCVITDAGIGMPPRVIFEKLLVPKLSDKPPIYELRDKGEDAPKIYYGKGDSEKEQAGKIVIQVGGIVIETETYRGVNITDTLVIDLPPSTTLGEQRDEVEVSKNTAEAVRKAIDQAVLLPRPDCFEVINSLGVACRKLQNRSRLYGVEENVFVYLQNRVRETFPGISFLPNKKEFLDLELNPDEVAFLDPSICQSPLRSIQGLREVHTWSSQAGTPLFEAKFKEDSTLGIIAADSLTIVDERSHVAENPEVASAAIQLAVGYGTGQIVTEAGQRIEKREAKRFDSLEELITEQWQDFFFKSKDVALRQVRLYERKNQEVCRAFSRTVFNQLQTVGAMEAWDILHWYVNADSRDTETKLKEIDQLAANISVFFNNPRVAEILQTNQVPILSMCEKYAPEVPAHIRSKEDYEKNATIIGGRKYFFTYKNQYDKNQWGSSGQLACYAEDGKVIEIFAYDALYRDENITVDKDKIIDTKTGETIEPDLPLETPLGTIVANSNPNDRDGVRFSFIESSEFRSILYYDRLTEKAVNRHWDVKNEEGTADQFIYFDGKMEANLAKIIDTAHIPAECVLSNVTKTENGDLRLTFANSREVNGGYYLGPDEENRSSADLYTEAAYVVDQNGQIVWQLNEEEWGDKIHKNESATEGSENSSFREQMLNQHARCMPIKYDRALSADDPVIKIVRYDFNGRARIREVMGYVTASGEVVHIDNTNKINATTLGAHYAWESSCTCCGLNGPMHIANYSPFEKGHTIGNFIKLPVTIIGEFTFDDTVREWQALSTDREGVHYMAIFDEAGNFLRADEVGGNPRVVNGEYDFRDSRDYLPSRLPDRLNDVDTRRKDEPYWSYKREMSHFMSFEEGLVFNRRVPTSYDSSYVPDVREVDNSARHLLDTEKGSLTTEQMRVFESFLLTRPVPDREKLERVAYRMMELRHLPTADIKTLLPVLYEMDYISPDFFTPDMVALIETISYLDPERFIQLFEMMYPSLPDHEPKKGEIAQKVVRFYREKLQSESFDNAQSIVRSLQQVRRYSNAIVCDGFTLIKHGVSVPPAELPRNIRPFLTYIQSDEDELAYKESGGLALPEGQPQTLRLSEIIQWKRLRESEAKGFVDTNSLGATVHKVTHDKSREHIVREITHAVHFQALNSTDLYVRELIQNAVDVMQGEDMDKQARNIEITTSATDHELVTHFHDPVGMDVATIINYFLVPGESTKTDRSKNFIGFYGQGVYTLFKNFKEINIKTSVGDGAVCYLTMQPIIEHGMIADVSIDFRFAQEEFKGTIINKTQTAENPYIEAAYVKDAVMTLTSALSDDRASVMYQGEKINATYKALATGSVKGLGKISVCRNPNNILSQHGLYVKDLNHEYLGLIPGFMGTELRRSGGVAIDLPVGIELTRSRQDIANKDKVAETLNPEIQRCLTSAYFESFKEAMISGRASFPYDELPYDYFSNAEQYEAPLRYIRDAEALIAGKRLQHIDEYASASNALKLMTLLPFFDIDGHKVSLVEIRKAVIDEEKSPPFDQEGWKENLPRRLTELMAAQLEQRAVMQRKREEAKKDAIPEGTLDQVYEQSPDELRQWIKQNRADLESLGTLTQTFAESIDGVFRGPERTNALFHYSTTNEIAHAQRRGDMSWNLAAIKSSSWKNPLEAMQAFRKKDGGKIGSLMRPLSVVAHEYGHVIEGLTDWTHDPSHDKEQARVLLQFLAQDGPQKVLEALKS